MPTLQINTSGMRIKERERASERLRSVRADRDRQAQKPTGEILKQIVWCSELAAAAEAEHLGAIVGFTRQRIGKVEGKGAEWGSP
jgi:hypothetical protein